VNAAPSDQRGVSDKGEPQRRRTHAERREEAPRRILEAAARIVAEKGLDDITLADAGVAAGYSRGLPAHYFGSKDDLLAALAVHIVELYLAQLRTQDAQRPGLPHLIRAVRLYFEAAKANPVTMRAFNMVLVGALTKPALAPVVAKLNKESATALEADIRAGIANGEIRADVDPRTQSILILAALRGVLAQWVVDMKRINLPSVSDEFVASLTVRLAK
jgi:AcrR family transcriptional regulator